MINTAQGMVSQLIQNNEVIAEGDVHPPCNNGEEASIGGPAISSYSEKNNSMVPCPTRCTLFIMYCQVEYGGGYCGGQFYFCGLCFGFW